MSTTLPPLLIIGASCRAAAQSALAAGFQPYVLDHFLDRDLVTNCQAIRFDAKTDSHKISAILETLPDCPWMYTGALENEPELIKTISERRQLWGICGESLGLVRYPYGLRKALADTGIKLPDVDEEGCKPGRHTPFEWLIKPYNSGGGNGVKFHLGEPAMGQSYLQKYIKGETFGATFLGDGGSTRLVGVAQAFTEPHGDSPWVYAGSIAPVALTDEQTAYLLSIGRLMSKRVHLKGLFCLDFIIDEAGQIWPIEVNPRYSSSMELHERVTGRLLIAEHAQLFLADFAVPEAAATPRGAYAAKRIIYAELAATAPQKWPWTDLRDPSREVADIPAAGTPIALGDPVMTVFAAGDTRAETLARLDAAVSVWRARIAGWEG